MVEGRVRVKGRVWDSWPAVSYDSSYDAWLWPSAAVAVEVRAVEERWQWTAARGSNTHVQ